MIVSPYSVYTAQGRSLQGEYQRNAFCDLHHGDVAYSGDAEGFKCGVKADKEVENAN
jgi:hypothetical protein